MPKPISINALNSQGIDHSLLQLCLELKLY